MLARLAVFAVSLTVLLPALPASAAVDLGPLETISTAVDDKNQAGWWSPLDERNGRTYLAYNTDVLANAAAHHVWITRRDAAGEYLRGCLREGIACAEFGDDVGHKQPSLAVDGDGYIHVFTAMHNSAWRYYRSTRPEDPTEFVNRSAELPDQNLAYTYPNVARGPNGDLWLIIRSRSVPTRAGARLYHWMNATNHWELVAGTSFAYQASPERTVYPDDVQVGANGDVHIVWEWQGVAAGRHEGSYLRYRPSTNTFHVASGAQVSVPVTTATPGLVYQPLEAGEVYGSEAGVRSAKVTVGPSGPLVAYRYREVGSGIFKIRRAVSEGGAWRRSTVNGGPSDTTAAVDVTHDGVVEHFYYVKTDGGGTAYVAERVNGALTETQLASGKPVQRLAITMRTDGTDIAYLCAPTAVSSRRGELYFRTIGRTTP